MHYSSNYVMLLLDQIFFIEANVSLLNLELNKL